MVSLDDAVLEASTTTVAMLVIMPGEAEVVVGRIDELLGRVKAGRETEALAEVVDE